MIKELLYLILLIIAFPSGIYLAKICKDEIKKWRGRMVLISAFCFTISVLLLIFNIEGKLPLIVALFFTIITLLTIVWKSYD